MSLAAPDSNDVSLDMEKSGEQVDFSPPQPDFGKLSENSILLPCKPSLSIMPGTLVQQDPPMFPVGEDVKTKHGWGVTASDTSV